MWKTFRQTADKSVSNTASETSIIGTGLGTLTLGANFWVVGRTVRIKLVGTLANTGTPTLQIKAKQGSTTLIDSTALTLPALTGTQYFTCEILLTCRTTGASGSVQATMDFEFSSAAGAVALDDLTVAPNLATVDTTASGALDVTATWGTASSSNTIVSVVGIVEVI